MSFAIFLFLSSQNVLSQRSEITFGIGYLNYTGDLNRVYDFQSIRPGFQVGYRRNVTEHFSYRYNLTVGSIEDSDLSPIDALASIRNANFRATIIEPSFLLEYHFLDFKEDDRVNWSPYLFLGGGLLYADGEDFQEQSYTVVTPSFPIGFGFKFELTRALHLGVEAGGRKVFTDDLDGINGNTADLQNNFAFGNASDDDWYYFTNLSLSILFHKIPCPYDYY